MFDRLLDRAVAYLEFGLEFVASHLLTIEGMVVVLLSVFFLGLLSRIRSI